MSAFTYKVSISSHSLFLGISDGKWLQALVNNRHRTIPSTESTLTCRNASIFGTGRAGRDTASMQLHHYPL